MDTNRQCPSDHCYLVNNSNEFDNHVRAGSVL